MNRFLPATVLVVALSAVGCNKGAGTGSATSPASSGPVLATVGSRTITQGDLELRLKEQPPQMRMRYNAPDKKRELLDDSIRMELLVQEARRRGLDKDPEVQRTLDRFMAQRVVKEAFEEAKLTPPSPDDIKNYYQTHTAEFERPERLRVSIFLLPAPKGDAQRPRLKAELEKLRKEILAKDAKASSKPGTAKTAFEDTLRAKTGDATLHATGGDIGLRTRAELQQQLGDAAPVALALEKLDDLSPVVETDRGVAMFKLTAHQPGSEESLEASKQRIGMKLAQERRTHALDEFVAQLRKGTKVEINDAALAQSSAPPPGAGGPPSFTVPQLPPGPPTPRP